MQLWCPVRIRERQKQMTVSGRPVTLYSSNDDLGHIFHRGDGDSEYTVEHFLWGESGPRVRSERWVEQGASYVEDHNPRR